MRADYASGPGHACSIVNLQAVAQCVHEGIVVREPERPRQAAGRRRLSDRPPPGARGGRDRDRLDPGLPRPLRIPGPAVRGRGPARPRRRASPALQAACEARRIPPLDGVPIDYGGDMALRVDDQTVKVGNLGVDDPDPPAAFDRRTNPGTGRVDGRGRRPDRRPDPLPPLFPTGRRDGDPGPAELHSAIVGGRPGLPADRRAAGRARRDVGLRLPRGGALERRPHPPDPGLPQAGADGRLRRRLPGSPRRRPRSRPGRLPGRPRPPRPRPQPGRGRLPHPGPRQARHALRGRPARSAKRSRRPKTRRFCRTCSASPARC